MKQGISLVGLGLTGLYQLVVVTRPTYLALSSQIWPTAFIALLNCGNGDLIPAFDMPVKIKPGFFFQGPRHDKDTDIVHAKAVGYAVPDVVSTTIGAGMPVYADSEGTCFYVSNGAPSGSMRSYPVYGSTPSTTSLRRYHHQFDGQICIANRTTVGTFTETIDHKGTHWHWNFKNSSYESDLVVNVVPYGSTHYTYGVADKRPNISNGSYVQKVRSLPSGAWSTSSSSTSTGMTIHPITKPVDLSQIPTQLVLDSIEVGSKFSITETLRRLSDLPEPGNIEWRSIQFALDSYRYFNGETLEMMKDLYHVKQLLPPLRAFASVASPRSWAQVFLWFKFGVLPTIMDAKEVIKAFKACSKIPLNELVGRFAKVQTRYGTAYSEEQFNGYKVIFKHNARVAAGPITTIENIIGDLFLLLKSMNIGITARNVWELVPYSFVVDWFVNTSQLMSYMDYRTQICHYKLQNLVVSSKKTLSVPATDYLNGALGFIDLVTYQRSVLSSFPSSRFQFDGSDPTGHWAEGTALVVSRLR